VTTAAKERPEAQVEWAAREAWADRFRAMVATAVGPVWAELAASAEMESQERTELLPGNPVARADPEEPVVRAEPEV
jgi:hypothetical protein